MSVNRPLTVGRFGLGIIFALLALILSIVFVVIGKVDIAVGAILVLLSLACLIP